MQNHAARRIQFHYRDRSLKTIQQKISYYRYGFSLEFQLISITDTDFGLKKRINSVIISATTVFSAYVSGGPIFWPVQRFASTCWRGGVKLSTNAVFLMYCQRVLLFRGGWPGPAQMLRKCKNMGHYRSSKWHYRQRKIIFELIMHFIADTDTDEYSFGYNFPYQM